MTDKELLELAAKAANYELASTKDGYPLWVNGVGIWNPLTDDGDALRLAVKLKIAISVDFDRVDVAITESIGATEYLYELPSPTDPYAATRRAIVRAAAEIGKDIK
jgi:hypothetical protein